MLAHAWNTVSSLDADRHPLDTSLKALRKLTLDEFGELLSILPHNELPHLSNMLPAMAPDKIQTEWTGSAGLTLLRQSTSFMNFVAATYADLMGNRFVQLTSWTLAADGVACCGCSPILTIQNSTTDAMHGPFRSITHARATLSELPTLLPCLKSCRLGYHSGTVCSI